MKKRQLELYPSPNFDERHEREQIKYLVYHFTDGSLEDSLAWLTGTNPNGDRVSAHYLISEIGHVYSLVPEEKRAWHAGVSYWENDIGLNSTSIGIELVGDGKGDYPSGQLIAVAELSKDILSRQPIKPHHVLGHSDIAPGRKVDPGPHFAWKWLAKQGIGLYPEVEKGVETSLIEIQRKLLEFGYRLEMTGEWDLQTEHVLDAFRAHYGPGDLGVISAKLDWLLEKKGI